jgi:hypothetical protein
MPMKICTVPNAAKDLPGDAAEKSRLTGDYFLFFPQMAQMYAGDYYCYS